MFLKGMLTTFIACILAVVFLELVAWVLLALRISGYRVLCFDNFGYYSCPSSTYTDHLFSRMEKEIVSSGGVLKVFLIQPDFSFPSDRRVK